VVVVVMVNIAESGQFTIDQKGEQMKEKLHYEFTTQKMSNPSFFFSV